MSKPEGCRPKGTGTYIRKIPSAHVISDIYHALPALYENLPKREDNCSAVIYRCQTNVMVGCYYYVSIMFPNVSLTYPIVLILIMGFIYV